MLSVHLMATALVAGLPACDREATRLGAAPIQSNASVADSDSKAASEVLPPLAAPSRLLRIDSSAYDALLTRDGDTNYLMTNDAAFRLVPGHTPERWALPLGFARGMTTDHLVYWSKGVIQRVIKTGGEPETIAKVPREPQRLVTSGHHVAWLQPSDNGQFSIHALEGSRERLLLTPTGTVTAMAMAGQLVYFVERAPDRTWRLGVVALSGAPPYYTSARRGRTPAMLAVTDQVYYYDGPSLTLRRVSPDLHQEDIIARDVICSPIFVAKHIFCAQPAGILELSLDGGTRRVLPLSRGTVTAISATPKLLTWVTDIGENQLAIDATSLLPGTPASR